MGAPSGTVTFLFTDVEGSTRLWESAPDAMRTALERHHEVVRGAIEAHGGWVFSTGGDGFAAAFSRAGDAVAAATSAQALLDAQVWPDGAALHVRMGLHTGETVERGGDYFGPTVNRAARLMATAHGGQVVCSQATAALVGQAAALKSLGEHRLRDLSAPEIVYQAGGGTFAPLRSVDAVPTNLPTVRTELIGRAADLADLAELVEREQIVTLTGVGGVGKTRLALGVAGAVAASYPDGCWLIEFAPVADGSEVTKSVAAAIGAPATDEDGLARYLADRRALLVLDNCEHVLADAADLVDAVLTSAPEVHFLATSREPLGVDGERVWRVGSLPVPDVDGDVDAVAGSPAAELFVSRAAAVERNFALSAENAGSVSAICRRLDGIPLAIELATARVRGMPPAEIEARLGERFRLLAGGSRRSQERHRTLLATVGWSYELLSEEEKAVFRRLAVFPASFDLAAAETVAHGGDADVVECVLRLVDRSLVQYETQTGRYRLLETLRQYAGDRLVDAVETDAVRARHGEYFAAVVESLAPELLDGRYAAASGRLATEIENLRALAEWCIDGGRWAVLADTCLRAYVFLMSRVPGRRRGVVPGSHGAWRGDRLPGPRRPRGPTGVHHLQQLADYPRALALADRSIRLAEAQGLEQSPPAWYARSHSITLSTRDRESRAPCERAFTVAEERGDEFIAIAAQATLAYLEVDERGSVTNVDAAVEAVRRAERSGHPVFITMAVIIAASMYISTTSTPDFAACTAMLREAGRVTTADDAIAMWLALHLGAALTGLGDANAVAQLARAFRLSDRLGAPHAKEWALRLLAVAAGGAGHLGEAAFLVGYTEANLRQHRIVNSNQTWITSALRKLLPTTDERGAYERAGAAASRRDVFAVVERLEAACG